MLLVLSFLEHVHVISYFFPLFEPSFLANEACYDYFFFNFKVPRRMIESD